MDARDAWLKAKEAGQKAIDDYVKEFVSNKAQISKARQRGLEEDVKRAQSAMSKAEDYSAKITNEKERNLASEMEARLIAGPQNVKVEREYVQLEWRGTEAGKRVVAAMSKAWRKKKPLTQLAAITAELKSPEKKTELETLLLKRAQARAEITAIDRAIARRPEESGETARGKNLIELGRKKAKLEDFLVNTEEAAGTLRFKRIEKPLPVSEGFKEYEATAHGYRVLSDAAIERALDFKAKQALKKLHDAQVSVKLAANRVADSILTTPLRGTAALAKPPTAAKKAAFAKLVKQLEDAKSAVEEARKEAAQLTTSERIEAGSAALEIEAKIKEIEESTHPVDAAMRDQAVAALKGIQKAEGTLRVLSDKTKKSRVRLSKTEKEAKAMTSESVGKFALESAKAKDALECEYTGGDRKSTRLNSSH